jgi:hypothetical protein
MTETEACREEAKKSSLELRTVCVLMEKDFAISGLARSHLVWGRCHVITDWLAGPTHRYLCT